MSNGKNYFLLKGGHPPETQITTTRAVFTEAYAVLPKGTMMDIVASFLPHFEKTRCWILARPLSGFAETFAHYIMEVQPGGGSQFPEPDKGAQAALFVIDGEITLHFNGKDHVAKKGDFVYIPANMPWTIKNAGDTTANFHWWRKAYEAVEGLPYPTPFIKNDADVIPAQMPGTDGRWATTRFMDPNDLSHDMHITIVTLKPGCTIPFPETHVMEHGLYVIEGKGNYLLNKDWIEVEAGDYMWLRAFCPQACYAGGPGDFRYLLYKDVNRHPKLSFR
ncbi:bifunctional allantoicase/(S)-ureidoglycine aminohydrolase [Thorsellia kenyensis]|uniref:Bifunctional allantoicase/(S)-ureidoglycine aminohydrolase n=1 Tax=Thorsellia kenyensis TaxID=1549888 RepID=A0ABV6C8C0_9GAMM